MASIGFNPAYFFSDPVYRGIVLRSQQKKAMLLQQTQAKTSQPDGGDDPPEDPYALPTGVKVTSAFNSIQPGELQYTPTYGKTPSEGYGTRLQQGIAANLGPILQSAQLESPIPIGMAAAGATFNKLTTARGPEYLRDTTEGGLLTQTGGWNPASQYAEKDGRIFEVKPGEEEMLGLPTFGAATAAAKAPSDYVGPSPVENPILNAVFNLAFAGNPIGTIFGPVAETAAGTPFALGSVGFLSESRLEDQYETQKQVDLGTPGNFAMKIGDNKYVTYQSTELPFGLPGRGANVVGANFSQRQFEQYYGANSGFDWRTVDWQNSSASSMLGERLSGFNNVGGFTKEGEFMDRMGRPTSNFTASQLREYASGFDPTDYRGMQQAANTLSVLSQGKSGYRYNMLTQTSQKLANQAKVVEAQVKRSIADYDSWAFQDDGGGSSEVKTGKGYTTVSGKYNPQFDEGDVGSADPKDAYTTDDVYFAEGGRVSKAEGEMVGEERDEMGPVGFVNGRSPEEVTDADTVRDDVEGSVPEGTFVINAVAVERYGSEKIRKLLMSALQEAEKQGIDISSTDSTIVDEDSVSVAVSEGEVLVPPVLVRIIGLEKLEKINAVGQEEVEERVEEYGQADTSEPVEGEAPIQASVNGGFVQRQKKAKGDKVDPRRVLPVSNFKSYDTPDEGRNWMNFAENVGATLLGKRDAMAKAFSYARNYAINNEAEDEYEDTMRHALVGGLYAGGPDDNVLQKAGSAIASGFADYKERSAIQAENIEPMLRLESAIDLNNNQYGRALRKAAGDEEAFVSAVENIMDRLRKGEQIPRLKNEEGKEITLVLSTADGRAGGFVNRQRKAPGGKAEKYEPYKKGDKREGLFDYSLEMFRLKRRLGDNSANMPRKEAQEPNDRFAVPKQPYEFTGNMIIEFSDFLREELDFGNPDDRRTYLQLMNEAIMYGSPQAVDQWYYSVEGHPLNDDMTDRNVDEQEAVKKSSKEVKEVYPPSFLMT